MEKKPKVHSPLFVQFRNLREKHPGATLLFRCGDFYETYNEDAEACSEILGITLTKPRSAVDIDSMAGFPASALDIYLPKLIRAGKRIAICDQLEESKTTKKLVKRDITELITPKNETEMESTKNQIEGIAIETLKALNGTLPSSLNKRFSDSLGTLQFINLKYTNNAKIFPDEMAYLIKYAEIGINAEKKA